MPLFTLLSGLLSLLRRGFRGAGRAVLAFALGGLLLPAWAHADKLRIGVTLHPYYSYVANIVGDKAEVVPLIPAGFNPHAYEPRADDIKRIGELDVIVLNSIGHDDFADRMIAASDKPDVPVIEANAQVPLLAATGMTARGGAADAGQVVNPHTFLSITASIAQVNTIARELARLDPDNAQAYRNNARAYGQKLRKLRADALGKLAHQTIETHYGGTLWDYFIIFTIASQRRNNYEASILHCGRTDASSVPFSRAAAAGITSSAPTRMAPITFTDATVTMVTRATNR